MSRPLFTASIAHDLMPMPRLTHGRRSARDNRYFANRNELAWMMMGERAGGAIKEEVSVTAIIYFSHKRRVDIDNAIKTVFDAMVYGGVLEDDHLVHHVEARLYRGADKGMVRVIVRTLEGVVETAVQRDDLHPCSFP